MFFLLFAYFKDDHYRQSTFTTQLQKDGDD